MHLFCVNLEKTLHHVRLLKKLCGTPNRMPDARICFHQKNMSVPTAHAWKDEGLETIATGRVRLAEKSFNWPTSTISFLPSITLGRFVSSRHAPCHSQPASDHRDLNYGCSSFIVCRHVPLCYFIRQRLLLSSSFTLLQPITFDISD